MYVCVHTEMQPDSPATLVKRVPARKAVSPMTHVKKVPAEILFTTRPTTTPNTTAVLANKQRVTSHLHGVLGVVGVEKRVLPPGSLALHGSQQQVRPSGGWVVSAKTTTSRSRSRSRLTSTNRRSEQQLM